MPPAKKLDDSPASENSDARRGTREVSSQTIREFLLPGSTPIPNRLFTILPLLTPSEVLVFLCIWRKTIGWQKLNDNVSLSQIQKETGVGRRQAMKASQLFAQAGFYTRTCRGMRGLALIEVNAMGVSRAFEKLVELVSKRNQCQKDTSTGVAEDIVPVSQRKLTGVKSTHTETIETSFSERKKKKAKAATPAPDFGNPKMQEIPSGEYDTVLLALRAEYQAKYQRSFAVPEKTKLNLAAIIAREGQRTVLRAYRLFLASDDEWLSEKSHPIGAFATQFENFCVGEMPSAQVEPMVEFEGKTIPVWLRDEKLKERKEMQERRAKREAAEAKEAELAKMQEAMPL
jgi:hypothetical protein